MLAPAHTVSTVVMRLSLQMKTLALSLPFRQLHALSPSFFHVLSLWFFNLVIIDLRVPVREAGRGEEMGDCSVG